MTGSRTDRRATCMVNIDILTARIPITHSGRDSAGNRAVRRRSSASSRGSRRRKPQGRRRRSIRCCSQAARRRTVIPIATSNRRRAMGPGPAGPRRGPCRRTTLKLTPTGIPRHREASAGLRTARPAPAARSSRRPGTALRAPILSGIHRLPALREHPTRGRLSPRIRATREAVPRSLLRSRRARRAPARRPARPAGCLRRRTRTRRTCRRTARNHLLSIRATHLHRGHLSRPRQMHMIRIRI